MEGNNMKPVDKGTIKSKNKALMLAAVLLAGTVAVSSTGCKGEIKASGISIDSLEIKASGDEDVNVDVNVTEDAGTSEESTPSQKEMPAPDEIVSVMKMMSDDRFKIPHINLDTDEIRQLNDHIEEEAADFIAPGFDDYSGYRIDFEVFNGLEGIYSIAIDYNYDGWAGYYKTYTFSADGHVLSTSEIIRLAGLSENTFFSEVKKAIMTTAGEFESQGQKAVVNGEINPDYEHAELLAESLSEKYINLDMPMIIGNDGKFYVCMCIIPFADPHDMDNFYSVPGGIETEVKKASWD